MKTTLEGCFYKTGGFIKEYRKRYFKLNWEDRYLYYGPYSSQRMAHKFDLAKVTEVGVSIDNKNRIKYRRFNLLLSTEKSLKEWVGVITLRFSNNKMRKLAIPRGQENTQLFDTWLYWLVIAIEKHSPHVFNADHLGRLKISQKANIVARRDLKNFSNLHDRFLQLENDMFHVTDTKKYMVGEGGALFDVFSESDTKDLLGIGSYGSVFKTKLHQLSLHSRLSKSPPMTAVKVATTKSGHAKDLIQEARALAALGKHPNIVGLIDAVAKVDYDKEKNKRGTVYLFIEFCNGGDLTGFREQFANNRELGWKIALGILKGMAHMHKRGIFHCDVKSDNVMIHESCAKIADFGKAVGRNLDKNFLVDDMIIWHAQGSSGYIPPEGFKGPKAMKKKRYVELFDSFQVGMTLVRGVFAPMLKCSEFPKDRKSTSSEHSQIKEDVRSFTEFLLKKQNNFGKFKAAALSVLELIQLDREKRKTVRNILALDCWTTKPGTKRKLRHPELSVQKVDERLRKRRLPTPKVKKDIPFAQFRRELEGGRRAKEELAQKARRKAWLEWKEKNPD
jgi:serine/threonine protein kinase